MKHKSPILFIRRQAVILAVAAVLYGLLASAYCQPDGVVLLLQQTPAEGGQITPAAGVHRLGMFTELALTAVAKPGYQFVYWLGDVSEPSESSTVVYLDAPKIVIAVFKRAEYGPLVAVERSQSIPGGGGVFPSAADYGNQGFGGPGGKRPSWPSQQKQPEPEPPEVPNFPVPEQGQTGQGDFPVPQPIPEPATISMLGLGTLLVLLRKRKALIST
jgi:hypothetical protein